MFVKICGITNLDDALHAVKYEASAVGFNFYKDSKRAIAPDAAQAIIRELPDTIRTVGVFVNADAAEVKRIASRLLLDFVQFHGDEDAEYVRQFGGQAIKAFRTGAGFDPAAIGAYGTTLSLVDAYDPEAYGGTGRTADWAMAREAGKYGKIILAGGLTPENVAEAIAQAAPFGVDVAGGIEVKPGKKDHARMKLFIENARRGAAEPAAGGGR